MKMVSGSSTSVGGLGPVEPRNFDEVEDAVHRLGGGHEPKGLEPDRCIALGPRVLQEAGEYRTADPESLGCGTDVHPLDLGGRAVHGLECAHADRVVAEAGHEQSSARAEQPWELATERIVVAREVGVGERDPGVLLEAARNPLAVLAEQRVDDRRHEISGEGRLALHAWFATPPRSPQLDFEALLRLLFADQTDKATLDRCLAETADNARELFDDAIQRLLRPYVTDDRAPFPERRHIAALVAAFVADYLHLVERWSEFARDEIRRWPRTDGLGMTDRTRQILDTVLNGDSVLEPVDRA